MHHSNKLGSKSQTRYMASQNGNTLWMRLKGSNISRPCEMMSHTQTFWYLTHFHIKIRNN